MATRRFGARPTETLDNLEGVAAPTVDDDEDAGYEVGSVWVDRIAGRYYICVDQTAEHAVWLASNHIEVVDDLPATGDGGDFVYLTGDEHPYIYTPS